MISTTRMVFVELKYLTVGTINTAKYLNSPELSEAVFALEKNVESSMKELIHVSNDLNIAHVS